jgi:hypothetical protein
VRRHADARVTSRGWGVAADTLDGMDHPVDQAYFMGNSVVAFAPCETAWHAVMPAKKPSWGVRNTLQVRHPRLPTDCTRLDGCLRCLHWSYRRLMLPCATRCRCGTPASPRTVLAWTVACVACIGRTGGSCSPAQHAAGAAPPPPHGLYSLGRLLALPALVVQEAHAPLRNTLQGFVDAPAADAQPLAACPTPDQTDWEEEEEEVGEEQEVSTLS